MLTQIHNYEIESRISRLSLQTGYFEFHANLSFYDVQNKRNSNELDECKVVYRALFLIETA